MTTEYEKQLEEEIISLKNLLDVRTRELDEIKSEMEKWKNTNTFKIDTTVSSNVFLTASKNVNYDVVSFSRPLKVGNETLSEDNIASLKHLWSLHMMKVNNPPLHYRIWRKIVSCLTTKKN